MKILTLPIILTYYTCRWLCWYFSSCLVLQ